MAEGQRKRGRPKSDLKIRDTRISGYFTAEDAEYIREVAERLGFTSTSELVTAIFERLCMGGFSGLAFAKLGWQFATQFEKKKVKAGYYLTLRPFPPLIGDNEGDPNDKDIARHLDEMKREVKEKGV